MRLERDERRLAARLRRSAHRVADHVEVSEVDAVIAPDGERDRPYLAGGKPEVNLQLSTFSGTKVRRSGSVWPSAMSRPAAS